MFPQPTLGAPLEDAARSLVVTATTTALHLATVPGLVAVGGHAADAQGSLLLPTSPDCRVLAAASALTGLPATAVLTDVAPLPVRARVRARLELRGVLTGVPAQDAAQVWAQAAGGEPLASGRRLLRLQPRRVLLDGGPLGLAGYTAARPDPLAPHEAEVLSHLAAGHPDLVDRLRALLRRRVLAGATRLVPLRLTRHALVLRVERPSGDTDVPVALVSVRAEQPGEVLVALRALLDSVRRTAPRHG